MIPLKIDDSKHTSILVISSSSSGFISSFNLLIVLVIVDSFILLKSISNTFTASIKAATTKSTSIKLSWEAVEGADAYRVYVANNGAWKVLKSSTDKTTFTATGLTAGKKYTFAVKAFANGVAAPKFAKQALQTAPGTTGTIKVGRGYTSIKLTWNKVSGATGYRVYQAVNGEWKQVRKSGTATTQTVKGLKAGKSYKFAVKAYRIEDGKVIWADTYKSVSAKTVAK
jgi:fibronectin type 3 domain-containing protein